jgi:hypothetical protein
VRTALKLARLVEWENSILPIIRVLGDTGDLLNSTANLIANRFLNLEHLEAEDVFISRDLFYELNSKMKSFLVPSI